MAKETIVEVKIVKGGRMPEKKTEGAGAFDCYARVGWTVKNVVKDFQEFAKGKNVPVMQIPNGDTQMIPLGFKMAMPRGVRAYVLPRSSMGLRTNLICPNSMGLIDSDYRGEVQAIFKCVNLECDYHSVFEEDKIHNGDRIMQMFFNVPNVVLKRVDKFSDELAHTARGENGFGSTGK